MAAPMQWFFCSTLLLVALPLLPPALSKQGRRDEPDHEMRFEPIEAEPIFESDGGSIREWKDPMMTHMAKMEARIVTLNQQSLLLPQYANSHRVVVILEGCARMGLILPVGMRANVRRVTKGEMIAVPRGLPFWMFNDGRDRCCFLTYANIWTPMIHGHHMYEAFHLVGGRHEEMGGILRGFSTDLLAAAFNIEEECVEKLVNGQRGAAIIRVREGMELPRASDEGDAMMVDFSYHLGKAHPDSFHEKAGKLTVANGYKLPVLKLLHMSVGCLKLEPNAMVTPGWLANGDKLIYCVRGSARIQMVKPNGEMACDVQMKEGSMLMVPRDYPVIEQAGDDGFDAAVAMNTYRPVVMLLAGKMSVWCSMPREVRMAIFNIDRETDMELEEGQRRRRHGFLLPPPSQHRRSSHDRHSQFGHDEEEQEMGFLQMSQEQEEEMNFLDMPQKRQPDQEVFDTEDIKEFIKTMFEHIV